MLCDAKDLATKARNQKPSSVSLSAFKQVVPAARSRTRIAVGAGNRKEMRETRSEKIALGEQQPPGRIRDTRPSPMEWDKDKPRSPILASRCTKRL